MFKIHRFQSLKSGPQSTKIPFLKIPLPGMVECIKLWWCSTVVPKDYRDKKNLPDMGPLSVNSIDIRGLLFKKDKIF